VRLSPGAAFARPLTWANVANCALRQPFRLAVMSALGHKRTFEPRQRKSALPPKAGILSATWARLVKSSISLTFWSREFPDRSRNVNAS